MNFEPLEIKNAILKELGLQVISDGGGRRFPHPGIEVQLLAPGDEAKNIYEAAFGNKKLQGEIHSYLQMPRCLKATPFVELDFVEQAGDREMTRKGFHLRYLAQTPEAQSELYLQVLEGYANRKRMRLVNEITYIGRCQEVTNKRGGIERVNDLYFPDVGEMKGRVPKKIKDLEGINNTVSRLHAHIKLINGNYFLFDDNSRRGTSLLPGGRGTKEVVNRFSGKKLNHNDIISFGKAMVKVYKVKKDQT